MDTEGTEAMADTATMAVAVIGTGAEATGMADTATITTAIITSVLASTRAGTGSRTTTTTDHPITTTMTMTTTLSFIRIAATPSRAAKPATARSTAGPAPSSLPTEPGSSAPT